MPLRLDLVAIATHAQKTLLIGFQDETCQPAGRIRACVDANSVGTDLRRKRRRVTVHNKLSVLDLTTQKRVSDIQKIIAVLAIEGHARPYAGVTEKIIANDGRNLERFKEMQMPSGETRLERRLNFPKITWARMS